MKKLIATTKKKYSRQPSTSRYKQNYTKKNPWIWILSGILAGVMIASSIFIKFEKSDNTYNKRSKAITSNKDHNQNQQRSAKSVQDPKSPVFEFYTELPKVNTEIATTEINTNNKISINPHATSLPEDSSKLMENNKQNNNSKTITASQKSQLQQQQQKQAKLSNNSNTAEKYIIQVRAVTSVADVDALKATLVLAGLQPKVETIHKNNITWYRIILGPFKSKQDAVLQQKLLIEQNFNNSIIIQK